MAAVAGLELIAARPPTSAMAEEDAEPELGRSGRLAGGRAWRVWQV